MPPRVRRINFVIIVRLRLSCCHLNQQVSGQLKRSPHQTERIWRCCFFLRWCRLAKGFIGTWFISSKKREWYVCHFFFFAGIGVHQNNREKALQDNVKKKENGKTTDWARFTFQSSATLGCHFFLLQIRLGSNQELPHPNCIGKISL